MKLTGQERFDFVINGRRVVAAAEGEVAEVEVVRATDCLAVSVLAGRIDVS